jgi:hypothetical protein
MRKGELLERVNNTSRTAMKYKMKTLEHQTAKDDQDIK